MKRRISCSLLLLGIALLSVALAGCGGGKVDVNEKSGKFATPQIGNCGIVVGSGLHGADSAVHKVLYSGQVHELTKEEKVVYLPCNSRNYVVLPENTRRADKNGNVAGDYFVPMKGVTKNGTKINVFLKANWTLNQSKLVLGDLFYPFCQKYNSDLEKDRDAGLRGCYITANEDGSDPARTNGGWTKLLKENFPDALSRTVREATPKFSDSIIGAAADWSGFEEELSEKFSKNMSRQTGFSEDIFCGSGDSTSRWEDPSKPGTGQYTCGKVRFDIVKITRQR